MYSGLSHHIQKTTPWWPPPTFLMQGKVGLCF